MITLSPSRKRSVGLGQDFKATFLEEESRTEHLRELTVMEPSYLDSLVLTT